MAYCDVCGNFDKSYADTCDFDEMGWSLDRDRNFQIGKDLYYYWDAPLVEDYDWRDNFPLVDCMCEICFDIANVEKKIKWQCTSS